MNYAFNSSNLFNADKLLSNNKSNSIITETDKSLPILINEDKNAKNLKKLYFKNQSNKNLSAGGVVAIVIPSIAILAVILAFIFKIRGSVHSSSNSTLANSEIK